MSGFRAKLIGDSSRYDSSDTREETDGRVSNPEHAHRQIANWSFRAQMTLSFENYLGFRIPRDPAVEAVDSIRGYVLQFVHIPLRLLDAAPLTMVFVEACEDVLEVAADGSMRFRQLKNVDGDFSVTRQTSCEILDRWAELHIQAREHRFVYYTTETPANLADRSNSFRLWVAGTKTPDVASSIRASLLEFLTGKDLGKFSHLRTLIANEQDFLEFWNTIDWAMCRGGLEQDFECLLEKAAAKFSDDDDTRLRERCYAWVGAIALSASSDALDDRCWTLEKLLALSPARDPALSKIVQQLKQIDGELRGIRHVQNDSLRLQEQHFAETRSHSEILTRHDEKLDRVLDHLSSAQLLSPPSVPTTPHRYLLAPSGLGELPFATDVVLVPLSSEISEIQQLVNEKAQGFCTEITTRLRQQDFVEAGEVGKQLTKWLRSGAVHLASACDRATCWLQLAGLEVINQMRTEPENITALTLARHFLETARALFRPDEIPSEVADHIVVLESKIAFLEGDRPKAESMLAATNSPMAISWRLGWLLEEDRNDEAAQLIDRLPLHDRWVDRAVSAFVRTGQIDRARQALQWCRDHADASVHDLAQVMFAQEHYLIACQRDGADDAVVPGRVDPVTEQGLRTTCEALAPILARVSGCGQIRSGLEEAAVLMAERTCYFLGDRAAAFQWATLLQIRTPVPLGFVESVFRRVISAPTDLPERLRRDYPSSYDAQLYAAVLEHAHLRRTTEAAAAALSLVPFAQTEIQRRRLLGLLIEIDSRCDDSRYDDSRHDIQQAIGSLLANDPNERRLWEVSESLNRNDASTAETILSDATLQHDGRWWQMSAEVKRQRGDKVGALADLQEAGRLILNPDLLGFIAELADELGEHRIVVDALEKRLNLVPEDVNSRHQLAFAYFHLQEFSNAAVCFCHLKTQTKHVLEFSLNEANCYAMAGKLTESLRCFDNIIAAYPDSSPAYISKSRLIGSAGNWVEAFNILENVRQRFWSEPLLVLGYMDCAHRAGREVEAGRALLKLIALRESSPDDVPFLQQFDFDDLIRMGHDRREQFESLCHEILRGCCPWALVAKLLNRPLSLEWAIRTQPAKVQDALVERATLAIYSTNGFTPAGPDTKRLWRPIQPSAPGQPVVADLTAIITLHRLGLLNKVADYFGTLFIPEAYLGVLLNDREDLQPHQRSREDAARLLIKCKESGSVIVADGSDLPLLHQFGEPPVTDQPVAGLRDVVEWLHQRGDISTDQFEAVCQFPDVSQNLESPAIFFQTDRFVAQLSALEALHSRGCLEPLLKTGKVALSPSEWREVEDRRRWEQFTSEIAGWHGDLADWLAGSPNVQRVGVPPLRAPGPDDESVGASPTAGIALAATLIAQERRLPLLIDDRSLQNLILSETPDLPSPAFSVDQALIAMRDSGAISDQEITDAFCQLMAWRYRFLVPPAEVLLGLARQFRSNLPGHRLSEVSHYLHDCLQDPGLPVSADTKNPRAGIDSQFVSAWIREVTRFLVLARQSPDFTDSQWSKLARWSALRLIPVPPRNQHPIHQRVFADEIPRLVILNMLSVITAEGVRRRRTLLDWLRDLKTVLCLSDRDFAEVIAEFVLTITELAKPEHHSAVRETNRAVVRWTLGNSELPFGVFISLKVTGDFDDFEELPVPANVIELVNDPDHAYRLPPKTGPLIFFRRPEDERGCIAEIQNWLQVSDRTARLTTLEHFKRLSNSSSGIPALTRRTIRLLEESTSALQSDDRAVYCSAAEMTSEAIDSDFLSHLSALRQTIGIRAAETGRKYLELVLHPSAETVLGLESDLCFLPQQRDLAESTLREAGEQSQTIKEYCDRFFATLGHLPVTGCLSLAATIEPWLARHPTEQPFSSLWEWAQTHSSPLAWWHVLQTLLQRQDWIAPADQPRFWQKVLDLMVANEEPEVVDDEQSPFDSLPRKLQLRQRLLHHYLLHLETVLPGTDSDAIANLAFWLSERIAQTFEVSGSQLGKLVAIIEPHLARTSLLWQMVRPKVTPSRLRAFALGSQAVWMNALASEWCGRGSHECAGLTEEAAAELFARWVGIEASGLHLLTLMSGTPIAFSFELPTQTFAEVFAVSLSKAESNNDSDSVAPPDYCKHLRDSKFLLDELRRLSELEDHHQQWLINNWRIAVLSGVLSPENCESFALDNGWIQAILEPGSACSRETAFVLLECQTLASGQWDLRLPHYFSDLAKRHSGTPAGSFWFEQTLKSSLAAGLGSAVDVLGAAASALEAETLWQPYLDLFEQLASHMPHWVHARLRAICLPFSEAVSLENVEHVSISEANNQVSDSR